MCSKIIFLAFYVTLNPLTNVEYCIPSIIRPLNDCLSMVEITKECKLKHCTFNNEKYVPLMFYWIELFLENVYFYQKVNVAF